MAILQIFLTTFIFLLPFGVIFRVNLAPNIYFYPLDLLSGLIFLTVILKLVSKKKPLNLNLIYPLAIFIFIGFISLLINLSYLSFSSFIASSLYLIRFICFASIPFSFMFVSGEYLKTINKKLIASGLVAVMLGFVQYFYYPDLKNLYYLGWDDHLYRMFGSFLDPNFAGAFFVLFFLFTFQLWIKKYNKNLKSLINVNLLFVVIALISIYLTYSRGALIMLLVGVAVLLIMHKLYKELILALLFIVFVFALFANTKIEGLNPFRIASTEARIETASQAMFVIQKNPLIGVGYNAYRYAQVRYGLRNTDGTAISNADAGTDNSYLFILATTGVVGLAALLIFWTRVIRIYDPLLTASVVALLVNSLFINSMFYIFTLGWLFVILGTVIANKKR